MQIASVNYCLFSAYPIALIGKADSQEDDPFPIAPFMTCCDSFPPKVHHGFFCIFLFTYSVFCVSGEVLVRGVAVKIEHLSVDFGC